MSVTQIQPTFYVYKSHILTHVPQCKTQTQMLWH